MKLAITYENGKIFGHFGHTEQFKIYEISDGQITGAEVIDTNGQGHGALAGFLRDNNVAVLICGGIGVGAKQALAEAGIRVLAGVTGEADAAADSFIRGSLVYSDEVTCGGHTNGQHSCGGHGSCRQH